MKQNVLIMNTIQSILNVIYFTKNFNENLNETIFAHLFDALVFISPNVPGLCWIERLINPPRVR